jgi:hypothetical protein
MGMSWPTGRGRRAFISVGPVAFLILAPFLIWWWALYLAWMLLFALIALCVRAARRR